MSWFADLAGKAESLLNNLDEQTGAALRSNSAVKGKHDHVIPDLSWQKKRTVPRSTKKNGAISETKSTYAPTVKSLSSKGHQTRSPIPQSQDNIKPVAEKARKRSPYRRYNLNHSPKTLVADVDNDSSVDQFGMRKRRHSLPSDLELINNENFTLSMQNLEVENAMLKNELNVMNREVSELLDRLRKTEDELKSAYIKLECSEKLNHTLTEDKETLNTLVTQMKLKTTEGSHIQKLKNQTQELECSISLLKNEKRELEEHIKKLMEEAVTKDLAQIKVENELRHAQTAIAEQKNTIDKTKAECQRIEKDWEAYKLRVKSMLHAKDNEIRTLQEGILLSQDAKTLAEQIETLKEEKKDLSDAMCRVRNECGDMQQHMVQLENRNSAAERVVVALRDALKEERVARSRAETQCIALGKEMQAFKLEISQTMANLRSALQDKEEELHQLRDSASTAPTSDVSALNVADYQSRDKDVRDEKVHYLTQMLIQKQGKVDSLLADNNILRIQLDKLESKYRSEIASLKAKFTHSVVHVEGERVRARYDWSASPLYALSVRIGVILKRFPIIRLFIMLYMIGLHLWVLTVLFTSTPEDYVPRATKL